MPKTYSPETRDADKDLVVRILGGSEDAKDEYCLRHRDRLLLTASALLGYQDPEAEDMVHETLIAGLQGLKGFEFRANLHTWLNQICVNLCLKVLKKRHRLVVEADETIDRFCNLGAGAQGSRAGEAEAQEQRLALLRRSMAAMKGGCKEILGLRYGQGLEYGAIADQIKAPIGTVMSRLSRCRESLSKIVLKAAKALDHG